MLLVFYGRHTININHQVRCGIGEEVSFIILSGFHNVLIHVNESENYIMHGGGGKSWCSIRGKLAGFCLLLVLVTASS
jgi:hypothetical protein